MNNPTAYPTFTIENITPDVAAHYLTFNTENRRKKPTKIVQYARDMAAGRWLMTGEPIKFSPDGILRDGQNRLFAVIEADTTVTMVVGRNIPADAMVVMDAGAPRSRADALYLKGYVDGKNLAAVANVHAAWERGLLVNAMTAIPSFARLTNAEAVDYVSDRPGLVEATKAGKSLYGSLRLPVGALAVAYDAFVKIDPDGALDFFDRIREMRTRGAGDPVATLIRRVAADGAMQRRILPATALYYLFRTWNTDRDRQSLSKLQIGSAERGWSAIPQPK